jgi:hypothetical protein
MSPNDPVAKSGAPGSQPANAVAPPALSKKKQLLFYCVLALFLLVFAEISLQLFYRVSVGRWLWQWWAVPIYEQDPIRVYRLKSNLDFVHKTKEYTARYVTDAQGLRTDGASPALTLEKPNDVFRVLALGPSFAFGWGVNYEDAYVYQLARQLRVPGKRVELINLGTPSQSIPFQLKWLRETGYCYQPDLILQTVYAEDPSQMECDDQLPEQSPIVKDGYLHLQSVTWGKKLRLWSASLFYGWRLYHGIVGTRTSASGDGRELYRKESSASDAECLRRYRRFTEFVNSALTNRAQIAFLYVPVAHVVRPEDSYRVKNPVDPLAARKRTDELASMLQSNQVHLINPLPALVKKDQSARTYFLYDIHFTPAGNRVVSEVALPSLQSIVAPAK